ncbi:MAG: ABC transporter substrate-binding protein [Coriobacteriia bacterium]|nr:ABC transporter substrate-binding protein [Coriobacteriia bacterium]MCL2750875.1 ABC transporter substrate-binding protein [Coriobacteriia bacterium]
MSFKATKESTSNSKGTIKQRLRVLLTFALAATLSLSMLVACQTETPEPEINEPEVEEVAEPAEAGPVTFTDDLGNTITVDNPQRVIAAMGSFGKVWELAGGTLIGVSDDIDTYSGYPLTSPNVARVGDFTSIDLEKVISLEPDFVIMTGSATGRAGSASQVEFKETLEASGITVAYFTVTVFEDYLRMLKVCTQITARADLFTKNGTDVENAIKAVIAKVPTNESPRILLMTTFSGGTRVQDSSTQTGAMMADLKTTNIASENPSLLADFSLEAIIEADPDFIFVVPMGENSEEAMRSLQELTAAHPAWNQLDAVKNGNYITLSPDLFLYKPNDRWAEAYETLFKYLYA